jgi:hypothetical protein
MLDAEFISLIQAHAEPLCQSCSGSGLIGEDFCDCVDVYYVRGYILDQWGSLSLSLHERIARWLLSVAESAIFSLENLGY